VMKICDGFSKSLSSIRNVSTVHGKWAWSKNSMGGTLGPKIFPVNMLLTVDTFRIDERDLLITSH